MFKRFRRTRLNPVLRDLVTQTVVNKSDFIYPLFIKDGKNIKEEIPEIDIEDEEIPF